jgi:hypothetical protein
MKNFPALMAETMSTAVSKASGRMKDDVSGNSKKKKSSKMNRKDFLSKILSQKASKIKKSKIKGLKK